MFFKNYYYYNFHFLTLSLLDSLFKFDDHNLRTRY